MKRYGVRLPNPFRALVVRAVVVPAAAALAVVAATAAALAVAGCEPPAPSGEATRGGSTVGAVELGAYRLVDLTHAFGEETVYWPTAPSGFERDTLSVGMTEGGWYYSAYAFSAPEHGGTHLDAPVHFSEDGEAAHEVPLERLVGSAVVIDVSLKAAENPDYVLTAQDVLTWEEQHGPLPRGSIVLLRTGWGERWPDRAAYLGDDTPGDASNLHFPSYGPEAARLLVEERGAAALGADVASIDYGQSTDFQVHRIAAARNVPGLENLANLEELPATGAIVAALPMKIRGGSGGPLRAIALVPRRRGG